MEPEQICEHIENLQKIRQPKAYVCEECMKTGDNWVHLRTCQLYGATLCCDASPNRHMTKHFNSTGHPVVISAETGERWIFCYEDNAYAEY
jgi:uncharacterized UBP type Zn finger protein